MEIYNPKRHCIFHPVNLTASNMAGGMPIRHNKQVWKEEQLHQRQKYDSADTECVLEMAKNVLNQMYAKEYR